MATTTHRESSRRREAAISRASRDIGAIPDIQSVQRRARARKSLRLFCETYNPEAFTLGWSPDHLRVMERIEEAAQRGALYAFAMPRGSGKTTICRMGALWAVSYRLVRYVFLLGANAEKAADSLAAVKTFIRFLPLYAADFPEISWPAQGLEGIANRAGGQLCDGQPTMIEWGKDRVILPTVPPPANWPKSWPLRSDGMVPTSGAVLSASGLTGDGIRGSLLTLTTGEPIRPDLVLLDDPQTGESAASPAQNATREHLVSADVLGMAGPGRSISAVMPCTVIAPGDFVDCILDNAKHPLWRGERTSLLPSMPTDLGAWEKYFEVYRRCAAKRPPDYTEANEHYRANRESLEAGAVCSWPERKLPSEVSAIQHAMHLWFRDPRAFAAEYQNKPLPLVDPLPGELTAAQIAARVNRHARGMAPAWSTRITAFIDVQQDLLFYAVCAWGDGFTGAVIDYGTYPDQRRAYYTLREARPTLSEATGVGSLEGSLWAGLDVLAGSLIGQEWKTDAGAGLSVERCLVDAGWGLSSALVRRFCRESAYAAVLMPSFGRGIRAADNPISDWPKKQGERRGHEWVIPAPKPGTPRPVLYDASFWKSFTHARLGQALGEKGALTLWGDDATVHRLFSEHLVSEYRVRTVGRGREVDEWKIRPTRPDNHFFDCLTGCCVAASVQGVTLSTLPNDGGPARTVTSFKEMRAAAAARAKAGRSR